MQLNTHAAIYIKRHEKQIICDVSMKELGQVLQAKSFFYKHAATLGVSM